MALNLDRKPYPGIGNVYMLCSNYYKWCQLNDKKPIIFTTTPEKIIGIKKNIFEITNKTSEPFIDIPLSLNTLFNLKICGYLHKIVDVPECDLPTNIKAGFSFRFGDDKFDDKFTFMNESGAAAMCEHIKKYDRVFVCSNKNSFIEKLKKEFGNKKIFSVNDSGEDNRFNSSHLKQWVLLSKCPIVYHSVRTKNGGDTNEFTSTFAPTAGVYGGCEIVGVDNWGNQFHGPTYYW